MAVTGFGEREKKDKNISPSNRKLNRPAERIRNVRNHFSRARVVRGDANEDNSLCLRGPCKSNRKSPIV